MAHRCSLTGKQVQFGHRVSHSNRKTNRRFLPNVQKVTLVSETLGRSLSLYVCTRALRTVQKKGGLDRYLLDTNDAKLTPEALRLKRSVQKSLLAPQRAEA